MTLKTEEKVVSGKSEKDVWIPPEGFIHESLLSRDYPDFLKAIADDPKMEFPILLDEEGPVFFAPQSGQDQRPKKFLPRTEYLVNAAEFQYWFNPAYRFDLDSPPMLDPEKGYERGNFVALDTEWNRQRMFRLQRCYRDMTLRKWASSWKGVMDAVNNYGKPNGMYGILPNMYAGVNVKAIKTTIARRPLDEEIRLIMEKCRIPLTKMDYTPAEVDQVIEMFRPLSQSHNWGQIIDGHYASGMNHVPCDTLVVELMRQVQKQQVLKLSQEVERKQSRAKVGG